MKDTNYRIIVNLTADVIVGGLVCLFVWYILKSHTALTHPPDAQPVAITAPVQRITLEDLLDAIRLVETGGELDPDNAIGDHGKAIGAYQLHKIYVRDANRILGFDIYSYEDRWDRAKSREMTSIVIQHYGEGDIETMARTHKCPTDRYKESTKPYWLKVKAVLYEN